MESNIQLSKLVDTSKPENVLKEINYILKDNYSHYSFNIIKNTFNDIIDLFNGKYKGYKKCNTEYHDQSHTMDAFLGTARLIDGYNIVNKKLDEDLSVYLLLAALFHDTGYIQEIDDLEGTGAKYTKCHVERSIAFLEKNYQKFKLKIEDVLLITKIINCTGIKIDWEELSFNNEYEKIAGCILGSADLLGQMSDRAYLEKLLFLYYEFKEAGIPGFNTEYDIIKNTLSFYELTKERFSNIYMNVYNYSRFHFNKRYNIDKDLYFEAIEKQIDYLKQIINDSSTNFRKKLKRIDYTEKFSNLPYPKKISSN